MSFPTPAEATATVSTEAAEAIFAVRRLIRATQPGDLDTLDARLLAAVAKNLSRAVCDLEALVSAVETTQNGSPWRDGPDAESAEGGVNLLNLAKQTSDGRS